MAEANPPAGPILVLGDSLSAAYNMPVDAGWVQLLARQLEPCRTPVVNASISGETSSGALARLPDLLDRHHPSIVLIELGGNDGLRGLSVDRMYENLREIVVKSRERGARVVLAGIQIPSNYGPRYGRQFAAAFPRLAREYSLVLIPFFLEGVALNPDLMQGDGIHPNRHAQPVLLSHVRSALAGLLPDCPALIAETASP